MKKILLITLVLFGMSGAYAQPIPELQSILDSSLNTMQKYSLNRSKIDWPDFKVKAYLQTKGIANRDSLLKQFPVMFKWLGDFHGSIQTSKLQFSWKEGTPKIQNNAVIDSAIGKVPSLMVQRWDDIGYYRVPGGITKNVSRVTQMLADTICSVDPSTVKGWILDLRLNTGGNVWFNLASLASMIGDGPSTGIYYGDDRTAEMSFIKDGKPFGNNQFYTIPNVKCTLPSSTVPVVILTSPATASSAEALLLAFKGRVNTIVIGEPTAGFVTSNNSFAVGEDVTLVLATGYMTDGRGRPYTSGIEPDITVRNGDDFRNLKNDKKVAKAMEWLNGRIPKK
ncbi:MAG TPA: S41 family peptidase [Daejeonella sp.]